MRQKKLALENWQGELGITTSCLKRERGRMKYRGKKGERERIRKRETERERGRHKEIGERWRYGQN